MILTPEIRETMHGSKRSPLTTSFLNVVKEMSSESEQRELLNLQEELRISEEKRKQV